jgi:formylglycine-generating enzyme required for sulfatase activity
MAIARQGPQFNLSWNAVKGRRYRLFSATDLGKGWREVDTRPRPLVAGGDRLDYTVDQDAASRFYLVAEVAEVEPAGMVWIPPGAFVMGSPEDEIDRSQNEAPPTTVTISRGFWMGQREVTQAEYEAVIGRNPSWFNGVRLSTDHGTDLSRPVEMVNWNDAVTFCAVLTEREVAAGRIPADYGFRLPTEAEWEYACRAGATTRYSFGDDINTSQLSDYAWWQGNSGGETHSTGQKIPNPWGLYDMHGNVYEWCQDYYADNLSGGNVTDPQGPLGGSDRVVRGGFWLRDAGDCRSAHRSGRSPDTDYSGVGFRVVLVPGQP